MFILIDSCAESKFVITEFEIGTFSSKSFSVARNHNKLQTAGEQLFVRYTIASESSQEYVRGGGLERSYFIENTAVNKLPHQQSAKNPLSIITTYFLQNEGVFWE